MSEAQLEARVAALEVKLQEEIDRLYNKEFVSYDKEIQVLRDEVYSTRDKSAARVDAGVAEAHAVTNELSKFVHDQIAVTVRDLIAKSDSTVVAEALREALKSTVLVTRAANRNDDPNNVLVVRPAPAASHANRS